MREVILNYWNWFADLVNPYHDVINTISTILIAAFTVVLARVALKQTRDARILRTSASTKILLASQAQQGRQRLAATKD